MSFWKELFCCHDYIKVKDGGNWPNNWICSKCYKMLLEYDEHVKIERKREYARNKYKQYALTTPEGIESKLMCEE